jgi:TetR/AcrR family transcriptional regulator
MSSSDLDKTAAESACHGGRMRGDERREQLIRVAIGLFARKGFNGTTTKEIAAAAGVTEALIFRHFPNKDALYEAILQWKLEEAGAEAWYETMRGFIERRDDEGLIRSLIAAVFEHHRRGPEFQRLMLYSGLEGHDLAMRLRDHFVRPLHAFLEDYIALRQREGAFDTIDPAAAVFAILAMPLHHTLVTNLGGCTVLGLSDEEVVEQFSRIALNALRARGGSEVR